MQSMRISALENQAQLTSRMKQNQEEGASSLESVHSRLHEETEKIVRWKVSTELQLNQKEKQVKESQKVIQALRNNLVEQQLSSEQLSQSLLREKNQREQIEEQVTRTRHMCNALKHRQENLSASVSEFDAVRDQLQASYDDARTQLTSMTSKFRELSQRHQQIVQDLTERSNSKLEFLAQEKDALKESYGLKEAEANLLTEKSAFEDDLLQECWMKISLLEEELEKVSAGGRWTSRRLKETQECLKKARSEMEAKTAASEELVADLQQKLNLETERLSESRQEFEEAVEKVCLLTRRNTTLEGTQQELSHQLDTYKQLKQNMLMDLQEASERLEELLKTSSANDEALREEKANLERELASSRAELESEMEKNKTLLSDFDAATEKLEIAKKKMEEDERKAEMEVREKTKENEGLVASLTELQEELSTAKKERDEEAASAKTLLTEVSDCTRALASIREEKLEAQERLRVLDEAIDEKEAKLKRCSEREAELEEGKAALEGTAEELRLQLSSEREKTSKLENTIQSGKKALNFELKKIEKLKAKIQTLEQKLKEKQSKSKVELKANEEVLLKLKAKVDELEEEKKGLEQGMEEMQKTLSETEKHLNQEIQDAGVAKEAAEARAKESASIGQRAQSEANVKIKEMMDLSESLKRDSETTIEAKNEEFLQLKQQFQVLENDLQKAKDFQRDLLNSKNDLEEQVKSQDEEILTLRDKLTQKVNEFRELQTGIKSLTESHKKPAEVDSPPLKTPSPSQYLPMYHASSHPANNDVSSISSSESSQVIDRAMKAHRSLSASVPPSKAAHESILKSNTNKSLFNRGRNVSFNQPQHHDSDSSEGFTVEIGSETDDRFDLILRPSQNRPPIRTVIPKANISPSPRPPLALCKPQTRIQSMVRQPPSKKIRYDRSSLRTYTSPKFNRKSNLENRNPAPPPKSSRTLPFENIFAFNDDKDKDKS